MTNTSTQSAADTLIVALDGRDISEARNWAAACEGIAGWMKVGMTLYYHYGPVAVEDFLAMGYRIFVDLKLHDIPHQVEGAAYVLGKLGVDMFTVHALGGPEMMNAAKRAAERGAAEVGRPAPMMVAVTVLTSMADETLHQVGIGGTTNDEVGRLAYLAVENGADGIVCSPQEARLVREVIGEGYAIVTPGIRPSWAGSDEPDDQARITTPAAALEAGATHLVVGRPITQHIDPMAAARLLVDEIEQV